MWKGGEREGWKGGREGLTCSAAVPALEHADDAPVAAHVGDFLQLPGHPRHVAQGQVEAGGTGGVRRRGGPVVAHVLQQRVEARAQQDQLWGQGGEGGGEEGGEEVRLLTETEAKL